MYMEVMYIWKLYIYGSYIYMEVMYIWKLYIYMEVMYGIFGYCSVYFID